MRNPIGDIVGGGVKVIGGLIPGAKGSSETDEYKDRNKWAEEGGNQYNNFDTSQSGMVFSPYGKGRLADDKSYLSGLKNQKWGQQNQGMFENNLSRMRDTMNGVGPSHGVNTLQAANQRTNAGLFSGAASARGAGGLGMASMNAANRSAANNQRVGQESELIRAMEADAARKGMFNAINQNRADTIAGESARYGAINNLGGDIDGRTRFGAEVGMSEEEFVRNQQNAGRGRQDEINKNAVMQDAIRKRAEEEKRRGIWNTVGDIAGGAASLIGGG